VVTASIIPCSARATMLFSLRSDVVASANDHLSAKS
jgi:hypothetical protein